MDFVSFQKKGFKNCRGCSFPPPKKYIREGLRDNVSDQQLNVLGREDG